MRSEAFIIVTCDRCGAEEQVHLTSLARDGWDERYVDAYLDGLGWVQVNDEDVCDTCLEEEEEGA